MKNKNSKKNIPEGFGKGVNDYFNHFITVADAKSGAILAANFILQGGLVNIKFFNETAITSLYLLTSICCIISIIYCLTVLYPRLPRAQKGLIFWENVKCYKSLSEYIKDVSKLDTDEIEKEYAKQNWYVSKVLSKKNKHVRIAITFFAISLILSSSLFLMSIYNSLI